MSNPGSLIRKARQQRGLNQLAFATLLGISQTSVGDAERRGDKITVGLLRRYGAALGFKLILRYEDEAGNVID